MFNSKLARMAALVTVLFSPAAAQATTYTYDFKTEANAGNAIGESIYSSFDTSSVYTGPNLNVTATAGGDAAFVYFDNGNAGMGVCKVPNANAPINTATGGSTNLCNPGSDDGITSLDEVLTFGAGSKLRIESIRINSNHDAASVLDSVWNIGGTVYAAVDGVAVGGGDIRFDIGLDLLAGESFALYSTDSPDSYISAIAVSPIPLPASGLLLLTAFGGLGAMRRRKKAA